MTPQEANFKLWWGQHYATRSLFNHNEEMARLVFSEVWSIAVYEASSIAHDVNPQAGEKVRSLT